MKQSLSSYQSRHLLGNIVFAIVAVVSFAFWFFELRFSMASYDARENEALNAYQQSELERKSEAIRDVMQEIHQAARMISLMPEIREATGGNRRSTAEDVVKQGRLSAQTHRMLQQVYANLSAYTSISEIYFIMDGFAPEKGDVPFFMLDDHLLGAEAIPLARDRDQDQPNVDESAEYAEVVRQLKWFREHFPTYTFGAELNAIPARISSLLRTCDNTQLVSRQERDLRDTQGFLYSIPVYDQRSGRLKGQISAILRANVLEAKLLDIHFLPVTQKDQQRMQAEGWTMPDPSPFVLEAQSGGFQIYDRRNALVARSVGGEASAGGVSGRWARLGFQMPNGDAWVMHHHLTDAMVAQLVAEIRVDKRYSVAGRVLLLLALTVFLGWGFWLMRASRHELLRMAHYDQLTDLPNRRLFFERMQLGMSRAKRQGSKIGLFFVDIANLNAINDRYGHHGGDLLLTKFAKRLHQHLRETDGILPGKQLLDGARVLHSVRNNFMLSRLGGDEFTILCEDLQTGDDLVVVAERILDCVATPFPLGDEPVDIKLNIGAALFPDDADDPERLLMSADSAMHECKDKHGEFILFNEEMRMRGERLHLLTLELRNALSRDQFELYYQPKAAMLDGKVVSMEALIRWKHPTIGFVSPAEFIPILERNGEIVELGEWIVEQACRDLHQLHDEGFPDIKLSVNVSVRQIKRGNFHDFLEKTMRENHIDPSRLILEITETMVIEDLKKGRESIMKLKDLGVSIAIDDFGSGYSSLTYLQHLPLDSLKIDKSLIDGMVDERAVNVVESVISLAKGLSLKTIAEGIETDAQRELIGRLGCDMIQGYLLSRPQPLSVIIDWLKDRAGQPVQSI